MGGWVHIDHEIPSHSDCIMRFIGHDNPNSRRPLQPCLVRPTTVPVRRSRTHAEPSPLLPECPFGAGPPNGTVMVRRSQRMPEPFHPSVSALPGAK